ncbi:unnamed protein product [Camellia sinensis]
MQIYIVQKSARIQDPFKNTKSSSNKAKAGCDSSSLSAKSPLQHPRRNMPSMKVFNDMLHELDIGRNNPDGADQGFIGSYFPDLLDQPMFHPPLNGYQACWNIQTSFGISNGCLLLLFGFLQGTRWKQPLI